MGLSKMQAYRKSLLPKWIRFFSWLFLIIGFGAPFFFAVDGVRAAKVEIYFMGLSYSGPPYDPFAIALEIVFLFFGLTAYGLLWGKRWGIDFGIICGVIASVLSISTTIIGFLHSRIFFHIEFLLAVPFLIRLFKIRDKWNATEVSTKEKRIFRGLHPRYYLALLGVALSLSLIAAAQFARDQEGGVGDVNQDLLEAAMMGDTAVVKSSLAKGAKVNAQDKDGWTGLMWAALWGHADVVQALLDAGANVTAKNKNGITALMLAAGGVLPLGVQEGHTAAVRALLEAAADVKAKAKDGKTALMAAAANGHTDAIRALLDAGADVNAKNKKGLTALMFAAWSGHDEVVRVLLEAGADGNAKDNKGRTALKLAKEDGHTAIVDLLKKAGAKK